MAAPVLEGKPIPEIDVLFLGSPGVGKATILSYVANPPALRDFPEAERPTDTYPLPENAFSRPLGPYHSRQSGPVEASPEACV
jgi:hypothetical protein